MHASTHTACPRQIQCERGIAQKLRTADEDTCPPASPEEEAAELASPLTCSCLSTRMRRLASSAERAAVASSCLAICACAVRNPSVKPPTVPLSSVTSCRDPEIELTSSCCFFDIPGRGVVVARCCVCHLLARTMREPARAGGATGRGSCTPRSAASPP